MKILFVAAEAAPFAKVGGLADVVGSLPKALEEAGHEVKIILPKYRQIDALRWGLTKIIDNWEISKPLPGMELNFNAWRGTLPNSKVEVLFIDNDHYFNRPEIYVENGKDYYDNAERFGFFCRAAMGLAQGMGWKPDVIHCHDWQTALIPAYLKLFYQNEHFWKNVKTVFTIHNLAYQGVFSREKLFSLGLPEWIYAPSYLEFWGNLNLMKAGLIFSDLLTTVSPQYAREIQTPEFGYGLEGVMLEQKNKLHGILNGIDVEQWDPAEDTELASTYNLNDLAGKKKNKKKLLEDNQLPAAKKDIPVIGVISRLVDQKGFDLIAQATDELLSLDLQMVILGTGEPRYHDLFKALQKKYPKKLAVNLKFDAYAAKMIYAGSDFFLMPSKFEPCGLGQMIAMAYGSVPIVRQTGGLSDTVQDFDTLTKEGTGFVFQDYTGTALMDAVRRALDLYQQKALWTVLVKNTLKTDFSWKASAKQYIELYKSLR